MGQAVFETARLLLRHWMDADRLPFAAMNSDPEVMRFFPSTLSMAESDTLLDRIHAHLEEHGFGLWAVEIKEKKEFAGFIGLSVPAFEAPFTPCVEIGWRLAKRFWNQGLATEGAAEVLSFGLAMQPSVNLVSFTFAGNWPSRRVMEKIGLMHDLAGDFAHPRLPLDHPLSHHVLYRPRSL